jgi:CRP-like cAMP-binding protein
LLSLPSARYQLQLFIITKNPRCAWLFFVTLQVPGALVASVSDDSNNSKAMKNILFDFLSKYVSLTEEEKDAIVSLDIFRSVKKGTTLLKEGQRSKESYFVLKGCIRSYYVLDGEEKTTAFYTEMEVLTPPCVVSKTPSEYYVSCIEDTILIVSNSDMEVEVNSKFPKFEIICRMLSEELLAKQRMDFDEFKTSSPEQRYLNLIQKRPDLIQRVPQHQLASYLGIKPQSLSRLRARIFEKSKA